MLNMSVASHSDHQDLNLLKKAMIQRRNNSGELDVFDAASYFSTSINHSLDSTKPNRENFTTQSCKEYQPADEGVRMSLREPKKSHIAERKETGLLVQSHVKEKVSKSKQPSSPGGRLASFLTSLFSHAAAKKKKKAGEDDPRPRMRRSSISHVDSRSILSSSSATATGFRTPPPVYKTFFDDSKSLQDHKRVAPCLSKQITIDNEPKMGNGSLSVFDKIKRNSIGEKEMTGFEFKKHDNNVVKGLELKKADEYIVKDFEFKKLVEDDGSDQSDTSSDLFELQNYRFGEFRTGLPVFETTNADQIKNSAIPVSK